MSRKTYLALLNPFELLRTKKVLHFNPTIEPKRIEPAESKIFVFDFDKDHLKEQELKQIPESFGFLKSPTITWINVDGLRKQDVDSICTHYGVHPLIIEDILSVGQRPKMDDINDLLFCVLNMLFFNEKDNAIENEQISLVLGKNFVLSFQEDDSRDVFNPLREKLRSVNGKLRQSGADFLFYAQIDMIVDNYFVVMEKLGERIEILEEEIVRRSTTRSLAKINILRKEMIVLKRTISPVRELVNGILKTDSDLIHEKTQNYFKDVYDHINQASDLVENYRDMMINLQDLYLSNVSLKMNEVMKVMAIVTCLLAPPTVIGGIFGMNFDIIPFAHHTLGFYLTVTVMLVIPIIMIFIFKRRGWF
ncbi:MAG: magnesium/cobalt transporter CorA [Chitinophagaceae bacterium]|jgi:magnesium transporter|nr:magnesium/cobalt transporter CorA [Chitinophagaceae bacterium]